MSNDVENPTKSTNTIWHHATITREHHEAPTNPEFIVNTGADSLDPCADQIIQLLQSRAIIKT